jgi:sec-independent protein translocase protein TatB
MFDIGFWEILLIGVVALLVIGPEKLPGVARTAGRWVGQMQRFVRSVRSDIERELETENLRSILNQQEEQIQKLKGIVEEVRDEAGGDRIVESIKKDVQHLKDEVEGGEKRVQASGPTQPEAGSGREPSS